MPFQHRPEPSQAAAVFEIVPRQSPDAHNPAVGRLVTTPEPPLFFCAESPVRFRPGDARVPADSRLGEAVVYNFDEVWGYGSKNCAGGYLLTIRP